MSKTETAQKKYLLHRYFRKLKDKKINQMSFEFCENRAKGEKNHLVSGLDLKRQAGAWQ